MSRVWFSSDLHLGHKRICKYREEFSSPQEHDEYVVESLLKPIRKRDSLWLLGDIFFSLEVYNRYFPKIRSAVASLNIVLGNHCTDSTERQNVVKEMAQKVERIGSMYKKGNYWITHAPIHPQELRGKRNIHGHMHQEVLYDERYSNVNVDTVRYQPISLDQSGYLIMPNQTKFEIEG